MAEPAGARAIGHAELAALKLLALDGALARTTKVSCADLGTRLDASNQTASRRLQALEDAGYVERELVSDGQLVSVTEAGEAALASEYEDYRRIFESDARLTLEGSVTGGMGEGRHYITLSGYMRQFKEKLGYEPFAGTLNVDLDGRSARERASMGAVTAVPIEGWEDEERTYGPAACYPATVEADAGSFEPVHVISPERTHHEDDQIELIAPVMLRDELGLADGDTVSIHVEER
jgi:riboflavin kinase